MKFDVSRAKLSDKAQFKPFHVSAFLDSSNLFEKKMISGQDEILVFELNNKHYGLLTKQMAYHHVANGEIDGQPFMISF